MITGKELMEIDKLRAELRRAKEEGYPCSLLQTAYITKLNDLRKRQERISEKQLVYLVTKKEEEKIC